MKMSSLIKNSDHPTLLEKKSRLYVVAGLAHHNQLKRLVYWFAINRYGKLAPSKKELDIQNIKQYREKYEPERGTPEWEDFMRNLPEIYREGDPEYYGGRGQWYVEESTETLVSMTVIPLEVAAPVDAVEVDHETIAKLIRTIRDIIWDMPVQNMSYLQAPSPIGQDILTELERKFVKVEVKASLKRRANINLTVIPEMTQYCVVATGEVVASEQQAIEKIKQIVGPENELWKPDPTPGVDLLETTIRMEAQKKQKIEKKRIDKKILSCSIAEGEYVMSKNLIRLAAEGVHPFVYKSLREAVEKGMSFEDAKSYVQSKAEGDFELQKEDYDEMKASFDKESQLVNVLVRVADILDQGGHSDMANKADNLIQEFTSIRSRAQQSLVQKAKHMYATLRSVSRELEEKELSEQADTANQLAQQYKQIVEQPSIPISIGL